MCQNRDEKPGALAATPGSRLQERDLVFPSSSLAPARRNVRALHPALYAGKDVEI